jgi:hypothetical protein
VPLKVEVKEGEALAVGELVGGAVRVTDEVEVDVGGRRMAH